ncbi:L-glyceraldehyde 3-phosphate reductase [Sphingomonas crusticola]|uniref:L-glyceraldehyde 3-phosphate reductase n=1 Tax=Sphingomonas crusticola TaxID=1697973 RepID=UPI000E23B7A3|nr:L-glyceraldehyde 3-phosphate reductase [Sphingomonas crusticola]
MAFPAPYIADPARYDGRMPYRRCGRSGLDLPAISLGLWQNFGGADVFETGRAMLRRAFDRGVTHFDLANNYGPPYGSAEENFGKVLATDFAGHRDELIISTKAGWDMWPGPYGDVGSSKKYLVASLDQSLKRMGIDYVDIFYSHRVDPKTPLEETMGALAQIHAQGKALYVGISSYEPGLTRKAAAILAEYKVPLLIHQPSYSMLNRWIEEELLGTLDQLGTGCIAFSPIAQGLLSDRYLNGVPEGARASKGGSFKPELIKPETIEHIRALNDIAKRRGQSLAQMAIAWVLRDRRVTSALIGARTVEQLDDSLDAVNNLTFDQAELDAIDGHARDSGINIWRGSSDITQVPEGTRG